MSTFVMPGVEVTNRYEHVDTPSTHTIADELHNRNKTDSATSWLSEWCVPSVNRANDSESLFFFLFFVTQMGPSRSNHPKNHIETETRHRFTIVEFALKFLTYCALFLGNSLYPRFISELKWVPANWQKNLRKCWARSWVGRMGGGICHGRAFQPGGELLYFLSLHATETRIGCCWIGILARVQIYLSMHSIRNK